VPRKAATLGAGRPAGEGGRDGGWLCRRGRTLRRERRPRRRNPPRQGHAAPPGAGPEPRCRGWLELRQSCVEGMPAPERRRFAGTEPWPSAEAASRACLRCGREGGVGEGSPEMAGDGEGGPGKEQPIEWPDPVMARWGGSVAAPLWCSCSSVGRRRVRAGGEEEGENR
jgi:hypothetical protein